MIRIETEVKINDVGVWNNTHYGKVQASSKALAPIVNEKRRIVIFVLEPGEEFPEVDIPISAPRKTNKYCKYCKSYYDFTGKEMLPYCPGCGMGW